MTVEQWERIQSLFHSALSMSEVEREKFLESASAEDSLLIAEVRAMLEEDARAESLLHRDIATVANALLDNGGREAPKRIGQYQLERLLGEGGMSYVLLVRRDDLGSIVTIKLLCAAWKSLARREL